MNKKIEDVIFCMCGGLLGALIMGIYGFVNHGFTHYLFESLVVGFGFGFGGAILGTMFGRFYK